MFGSWSRRALARTPRYVLALAIAAAGLPNESAAQAKTPREQIEELVSSLDSADRVQAEAYLASADSLARYQALRGLQSSIAGTTVGRILTIVSSSDPSPRVRSLAVTMIGQRRERRDEVVTLLQRIMATDTVPGVRVSALSQLYPNSARSSPTPKGFEILSRIIKRDTAWQVRSVAAGALASQAKSPTDNRELLATYRALAKDPAPEVRATIIRSMANPGLPRSIDKDETTRAIYLEMAKNDENATVRVAALQGLSQSDLRPSQSRSFVASRIQVETDSAALATAIRVMRSLSGNRRDTLDVASLLTRRIRAMGPLSAPRWLAIEQQRAIDQSTPNTIPWFMRIPISYPAVPSDAKKLRLVAFGDWADQNNENQRAVSGAIRAEHQKSPFDLGLTLGDNFYGVGIESPRSPRWEVEFEQQYGVLGIPIFGTLGNHDYYMDESPAAEIAYTGQSKSWKMPATHYSVKAGPAELFVIDTEQLSSAWQLAWLDSALATSNATWKIVAGHYDIFSNRSDGSGGEFEFLVALFKKHGVAVYLNGHYHTLQHHQVDGIDYVTSGGGGRSLYPLYQADSGRYRDRKKFATQAHGFAVIEVTPDALTLKFVGAHGEELYSHQRKR